MRYYLSHGQTLPKRATFNLRSRGMKVLLADVNGQPGPGLTAGPGALHFVKAQIKTEPAQEVRVSYDDLYNALLRPP